MEFNKQLVFSRVLLLIVLVGIFEIGIFFYKYVPNKGPTGLSINEDVMGAYNQISDSSKMFLIVQWVLLMVFLMFAYVKDGRTLVSDRRIVERDLQDLSSHLSESETTLDMLYSLLKKRRSLRLSTIAKAFRVDKDLAKEWVRVLESGDLVIMEKSGGEIFVRINERAEI
jgi:hypothetical protein